MTGIKQASKKKVKQACKQASKQASNKPSMHACRHSHEDIKKSYETSTVGWSILSHSHNSWVTPQP